jgi:hypothetical protein
MEGTIPERLIGEISGEAVGRRPIMSSFAVVT